MPRQSTMNQGGTDQAGGARAQAGGLLSVLALSAALLMGSAMPASAQSRVRTAPAPAVPASAASPATSAGVHLTEQALVRQRDAAKPGTLVAEGQSLYARDVVKLDGYAYCGQAVSLAEQGEFRQSIRAASKALYLGERDKQPALQAVAHRDLALTYLYAGQLDEAEQYARSALAFPGANPEQVLAPSHKILGDVMARRGDHVGAMAAYQDSLKTA